MGRRELLAALGAAGAVGGAATGTARGQQAGDWPSFQRDLANTGLDSSTTGPTADFDGDLLFESDDVVGTPVLANGTLYAATSDGVVALDPSSGDVGWRDGPDPGRTYAPILVREGLLYVAGDGDAHLRALDTATGDVQWMREIGRGAPAYEPTNDVVYLAGYALDATTGDDRWRAETSEQEYTPPAVGGGRLYVIDRDRNLVAIDASDGSTVWQRSGSHTASVTFVAEASGAYTPMVLVPIDYSKVVAYRADDGLELWRSPDLMDGQDLTTSVAVTPSGGALAVVTYGDATALYLQDGSVAWETGVSGFLNTPPAIVDDVAYSATNEELLVALDVTDGTVLESGVVGRPKPYAAPVVSDDTVFLTDRNGLTRVDGDGGGGGGGTVELRLEMEGDTARQGGTAVVTYRVTNEGDAEATGLRGLIDVPSDDWDLVASEDLTAAGPGETDVASVDLAVPADAEGDYEIQGLVEDDAGNRARDTATVTVARTPGVDVKGIRLAQRTVDTVVERPDESVVYRPDQPRPIEGLPTVADVQVPVTAIDRLAEDDRVGIVFEYSTGGSSTETYGELTVTGEQLLWLDGLDPDRTFEALLEEIDDVPTFPLRPEIESVTVRVEAVDTSVPFDGAERTVDVDEALVGGTTDDVVTMPPLNVGFVEVVDADGGANYGHPRDGGVRDFGTVLKAAILGLKRQFPTPDVNWYAAPDPVAGGDDVERDLKDAYDLLADADETGTIDRFDATVAIVPREYFAHHDDPDTNGLHKSDADSGTQPPAAAAVRGFAPADDRGCEGVANTTAHEVGHHMLPFEAYPEPMSARCEDGLTGDVICQLFDSGLDRAHARMLRAHDDVAVDIRGYDLGGYEVPAIAAGDCGDVADERDRPTIRTSRSLMAPMGTGWIDARHHNDMVSRNAGSDRFDPAKPVAGTGAETTVASAMFDLSGETPTLSAMTVRQGVPSADGAGDVEVTVEGPTGEALSTVRTARRGVLIRQGGGVEITQRAQVAVPFEEEATGLRIRDEGAADGERTVRVNALGGSLASAVRTVPDRALAGDPEESRARLLELTDDLATSVDEGAYTAARETLETFEVAVRDRVAEYDAAGNQYTRQELVSMARDTLDRLDRVEAAAGTQTGTATTTTDEGAGLEVPSALAGLAGVRYLLGRRREDADGDADG